MTFPVEAICTGQPVLFRGEEKSAFAKRPVAGPITIAALGIAGDAQADRVNHGGPDMAVHHYPLDHHDWWRDWLPGETCDHTLLADPGAFGSNLAVSGLTETDVHIGDRFRLGTALLEVSQPRKPCWKIEHRFGHKGMVAAILKSGRCGWYYRVIEEGTAQAGDMLTRIDAPRSQWSVEQTFFALIAGQADRAELQELAALPQLSAKLRGKAQAKLNV